MECNVVFIHVILAIRIRNNFKLEFKILNPVKSFVRKKSCRVLSSDFEFFVFLRFLFFS